MAELKRAVAILIVENGKILAINKGNVDPLSYALVGGKCNTGESFEDAAIRELKEEAGLDAYDMELVFEEPEGAYIVQTFVPRHYYGDICSSNEGEIMWITPDELLAGTYSDYNRGVLQKVGMV